MNAQQVMKEVSATGARFVIKGDEIGLTQVVSDELLLKAKTCKSEIRKILLAVKRPESNVVNIAKARLIRAGAGLDISIDELMSWYSNDFQFISEMKTLGQLRWCIEDYIKLKKKRCKK